MPGSRAVGLEALVSTALELRDAGRADWLREACKHRPEVEEQVRALVERARAIPALMGRTAEFDPLLGQCLGGRFRLIERIGAGAMGVVYLAEDSELKRKVACKVVRHGLMAPEQALERFAREARAMAAVQHPSVVTIHDRGRTDDDHVYIVMELVDGAPLSELLEVALHRLDGASPRTERSRSDDNAWIEERFDIARRDESSYLRTVVRWTADLALGLEAVHQAGVLHRDIKPSNILVRRDGGPALLDFGIALLDDSGSITRGPTSLGTPAYMPPEALQREVKRTPASDVYSLAATLYHMVTLRAPYEGTPTQVLAALATREPLSATQRRPGLPRDLQAILDKGMHRKPATRYASAAEFEADLRAFLEFRPITARPVTAVERAARRLIRSRAALGALITLAIVVLFFGARAWREHALDVRRARLVELQRHFPPNFSIVGPANRVYRYEADRAALATLLDEAADVAVEPLPTFLLRASFRLDHGDPAGAARDIQVVADFVATPFTRALAARYAAPGSEKSVVRTVDLKDLPSPETPVDRYLLAYHLLRNDKGADAIALLSDSEVRRIPHAEEMLLAATNFVGLSRAEQHRLALERYADVVRLEGRIGARTATTAHIAGAMLAFGGRFDEALRVCDEGIELAPRAYILRINAGASAFAEHKLTEAREHLEVARDLRPNYWRIVQNLMWVEIAERRFDAADKLVRDVEPGLQPKIAFFADYWCAAIAAHAALDAQANGDVEACSKHDADALALFKRLPDQIRVKDGKQNRIRDADGKPIDDAFCIAKALDSRDEQALVLALAGLLEEDPDSWWRQQLLATHMPSKLSPEATAAVRRVIEALGTRTLPGASR